MALSLGLAHAEDVLVLTTGRRVKGRIVAEEKERVRLEIEGGAVWFPRSKIAEIRRGRPVAAKAPRAEPARAEYAVLRREERRAGARRFLALRKPTGMQFEEEVVFLDAAGKPTLRIHTLELCDAAFEPLSFIVRESSGPGTERKVACRVRDGRLEIETATRGKRRKTSRALPKRARFRFAAREMFLRRADHLGGTLEALVFDSRDRRWRAVRYAEAGRAPHAAADGTVSQLRRIRRERGDVVEHELLDASHRSVGADLNGGSLRAERTTRDVFRTLRGGDAERVTGEESRDRTWYADGIEGFRVAKPGAGWTFELPLPAALGTLVVLRSEAAYATVDVQTDLAASPGVTLERAADAVLAQCKSVAADFELVADGYRTTEQGRFYWFDAKATTKGSATRTRGRVFVVEGKVYRLLGACPPALFDTVAADFDRILDSFETGYASSESGR